MWTRIKWGVRIVLVLIVLGFFHYTLPQRDIVRIVGVRQEPMSLGWENRIFYARSDAGMAESDTRTIKLIDAFTADGAARVYRNEDTGWGWPPYFKLDSQNVQAIAQDQTSTEAAPKWVAITHYGWRSELITIFPNAVSIIPVDDENVRLIPWVNIILLTFLAFGVFMIRKMWLQFRERMVDPTLADVSETFDAVGARAEAAKKEARGFFGRLGAWLGTWRAKR
ncbi:Bacteriophage phiNM3, A0EWY4 [Paracoccaceae bacterium]|jgi:hypothetical protein